MISDSASLQGYTLNLNCRVCLQKGDTETLTHALRQVPQLVMGQLQPNEGLQGANFIGQSLQEVM